MLIKKYISIEQKPITYYQELIKNNYSKEYILEVVERLSDDNPHIPPWLLLESLDFVAGDLYGTVAYKFVTGELAWVKNPKHRIKYLGTSLATTNDDVIDQQNVHTGIEQATINKAIEINTHEPPWTFLLMGWSNKERYENKLIAAFNEGEIIWVKDPDERKSLFDSGARSNSDAL